MYRGAKNKLLQRQPIQAVDYLKMEPYFQGIKKDVAKMDQQTSDLVDQFPFLAQDDEFLKLEALKMQEQDRLNDLFNNPPWK